MAFVSIALPAIGSLASAALPAIGSVAGGLGTALSGLPMVGGPLSSILGTTAGGGGLGGMFTGLGGAGGLPGLTGTLGGGGGLFGGAPAGTTTVGGSSYAPGALPGYGAGIMPGSGGGIGQGFGGLFGQGGLLGQGGGLTQLAQSPLVQGYQSLGKLAGVLDPQTSPTGTGTGTGIGTGIGAGATGVTGAAGPALAFTGGGGDAAQYGLQPGVLNFGGGGSPYGVDYADMGISPAVALEIDELRDDVDDVEVPTKSTDSQDLTDSIERTNKKFAEIFGGV